MTTGKIASQASHAALNSFLTASKEVQKEYQGEENIGTKVCLNANVGKMVEAYNLATQAGLPCALITDSGPGSGFDTPTLTAVGIGPCTKAQVPFLKKFQLMK